MIRRKLRDECGRGGEPRGGGRRLEDAEGCCVHLSPAPAPCRESVNGSATLPAYERYHEVLGFTLRILDSSFVLRFGSQFTVRGSGSGALQFLEQPGFGKRPLAFDGLRRNIHPGGGLVDRQAPEKTELDDPRLPLVLMFERF